MKFVVQASGIASDRELRVQIANELRPLAVATDQEAMLDDFISGNPLPFPERFRRFASGASVIHAQLRTVGNRVIRLAGPS